MEFRQTFRVSIDGQSYAFNCLPFGWQFSLVLCQTVLGYLLHKLHFVSVLLLHYLDDFLVIGFGAGNVRSAARRLVDLLSEEGAIISPKSILDPVSSITWLGKRLVLSGPNSGVFVLQDQWVVLVGLWLRIALFPLSQKFARRVIGRLSWALRPKVGVCPLLAGWWSHVAWGLTFLPSTPLKLVFSALHCLVMARCGWSPRPILPPSQSGRGLLFVDAAFDQDRFKVGVWGPGLGGRVFHCPPDIATQQEAQLHSGLGPETYCQRELAIFPLFGDNESAVGQMSSMRAKSGLYRHNRNLRRAFYLLQRAPSSVFLEGVPGDLNPADCFSRVDSDFAGHLPAAEAATWDRFKALQAFPSLPRPVWLLNFPEGRGAAASQIASCPVGAAS